MSRFNKSSKNLNHLKRKNKSVKKRRYRSKLGGGLGKCVSNDYSEHVKAKYKDICPKHMNEGDCLGGKCDDSTCCKWEGGAAPAVVAGKCGFKTPTTATEKSLSAGYCGTKTDQATCDADGEQACKWKTVAVSDNGEGTSGKFVSKVEIKAGEMTVDIGDKPASLKKGMKITFSKGTPQEETREIVGGGKNKRKSKKNQSNQRKTKKGGAAAITLSQPLSYYHPPGASITFTQPRDVMAYYFGKPKKRKKMPAEDCLKNKVFNDKDGHEQELGFVKPIACRLDTLPKDKIEYYTDKGKGKGYLCEHPYPETLEKCQSNDWYRSDREENMDGLCDKCSAIKGSSINHFGYDNTDSGEEYPSGKLRKINETDFRSINRLLAKPCFGRELYMFNHLPDVREEGQCVRIDNTNNRLNAYNFPYINSPTCNSMRDDLIDAAEGIEGYLFTDLKKCNNEARLRVCRNKSLPIVEAVTKGKMICPDTALTTGSRMDVARCIADKKLSKAQCEQKYGAPALSAAKTKRDAVRQASMSGLIH